MTEQAYWTLKAHKEGMLDNAVEQTVEQKAVELLQTLLTVAQTGERLAFEIMLGDVLVKAAALFGEEGERG
jgi:hypothetical protein